MSYLVQIINGDTATPGATYEVFPDSTDFDSAVELAFKVLKSNKNPNGSLKKELWDEAKSGLDTDGYYDNVFIISSESWEDCPYCGGECPNQNDHHCDGYSGDIDGLADDQASSILELQKTKQNDEPN